MTDVRLIDFVMNKVDYLYHENLALIEDVYRDTIERDCQLRREILKTQLVLASTNPDEATTLLSMENGVFGRVTGEVLVVFKCLGVQVQARNLQDPSLCTKQFPALYGIKDNYVEPITRIITTVPTFIPCSRATYPEFRLSEDTWISIPHRTIVKTPRTLSTMRNYKTFDFSPLDSIKTSGLYTPEDLEKARNHLFFPQVRQRIITEMVQQVGKSYSTNSDFDSLFSPNVLKKAVYSWFWGIWEGFISFGKIMAGLLGIYVVYLLSHMIITRILAGYNLYQFVGYSWRMMLCCCPAMANQFIHHKSNGRLRRLINMIKLRRKNPKFGIVRPRRRTESMPPLDYDTEGKK